MACRQACRREYVIAQLLQSRNYLKQAMLLPAMLVTLPAKSLLLVQVHFLTNWSLLQLLATQLVVDLPCCALYLSSYEPQASQQAGCRWTGVWIIDQPTRKLL